MHRVVVITGPTASGKSDLAEKVALAADGEIVSADSMQIYRGMDIGTAKVPLGQRKVPYHCIDIVDPGEPFSAALFQDIARKAIEGITGRGKLPVICGGTGLYIQAVIDRMEFPEGEQEDNPVRERYRRLADELGPEGLHELLEQKDPASAALIHKNNVRRVVRAFELLEDGKSYAELNAHLRDIEPFYDAAVVGLAVAPEQLVQRIDARVDAMMSAGLLAEVAGLLERGFRSGLTAPQAIGYKELVPIVDAHLSPDSEECRQAVERIKIATRRYAKRQRTWFRRDPRIQWIDAAPDPQQPASASQLTLSRQSVSSTLSTALKALNLHSDRDAGE